jgi:hypothetical protein
MDLIHNSEVGFKENEPEKPFSQWAFLSFGVFSSTIPLQRFDVLS